MYKKFVIALVLVAHFALPSSAQVQFRGACPTPNPVAAFSPDIADKVGLHDHTFFLIEIVFSSSKYDYL